MIIVFTGTRRGMTKQQQASVAWLLEKLCSTKRNVLARHGAAKGADREFHALAFARGVRLTAYPSTKEQVRWALTRTHQLVSVRPTQPPLIRNKTMVMGGGAGKADVLIATPAEAEEVLRSGTWATIRNARRALVAIRMIVQPLGNMIEETRP